jgi:hypothetical protein
MKYLLANGIEVSVSSKPITVASRIGEIAVMKSSAGLKKFSLTHMHCTIVWPSGSSRLGRLSAVKACVRIKDIT